MKRDSVKEIPFLMVYHRTRTISFEGAFFLWLKRKLFILQLQFITHLEN